SADPPGGGVLCGINTTYSINNHRSLLDQSRMARDRTGATVPHCIARGRALLPCPVGVAGDAHTTQHMQPMVIGRTHVIHLLTRRTSTVCAQHAHGITQQHLLADTPPPVPTGGECDSAPGTHAYTPPRRTDPPPCAALPSSCSRSSLPDY